MTSTNTLNRVERACAQLHHDGQQVTFTAVAAATGMLTVIPDADGWRDDGHCGCR